MLLLPALNAMFDIMTTRIMAAQVHPPAIIVVMLFGLALVSAPAAGCGSAGSALHSGLPLLASRRRRRFRSMSSSISSFRVWG